MAAAAPTGCFKCGRPGHWSRDCPSAPSSSNPSNPNPNPRSDFPSSSKFPKSAATAVFPPEKPKKAPKTRPKLTPDLLLSDDGLGYILKHFPRSFKSRGRGHEASDLGNLIGLYTQWHSHLLPYYSFDQFVQKVEQVGASKRVRRCVAELRERVARGGDPTKLHEPPVEEVAPDCQQAKEDTDMEVQNADMPEPPLENHVADEMQEDMFNEIYQNAIRNDGDTIVLETRNQSNDNESSERPEQPRVLQNIWSKIMMKKDFPEELPEFPQTKDASEANHADKYRDETPNLVEVTTPGSAPKKIQLTEEQKALIVANRQKALERAAAKASSSQAS